MEFLEFKDLMDILLLVLKDDFKEQMLLQAFGSWQIIEALKAFFDENSTGTSFQEYAEKLGLLTEQKEEMTKEEMQKQKIIALQKAESIVKAFKQQQGAKE